MNIAERLEQMMESKSINKSQLAKGANIPYTTIDGIFKSSNENIKLNTLTKLADYFNVSIDYLVGRSPLSEYHLEDLELIKSFEQFLKWRKDYGSD